MRFQKASVGELQVGFNSAHRPSFGLGSQSIHEDSGYQDTNEAQSYRKLVERVTRHESGESQHDCDFETSRNKQEEGEEYNKAKQCPS
jgi:hypothetical protein